MRCSVNRLLQLATKPRLQSMRSDTSSHVWPSASSKISRARRASSARSVRLLARRVSSISSEFDNVMASLMDAIIVYKWLLQSSSNKPTNEMTESKRRFSISNRLVLAALYREYGQNTDKTFVVVNSRALPFGRGFDSHRPL